MSNEGSFLRFTRSGAAFCTGIQKTTVELPYEQLEKAFGRPDYSSRTCTASWIIFDHKLDRAFEVYDWNDPDPGSIKTRASTTWTIRSSFQVDVVAFGAFVRAMLGSRCSWDTGGPVCRRSECRTVSGACATFV